MKYLLQPFSWKDLVHPLVTRCEARTFHNHCLEMKNLKQNCKKDFNEITRPKVLVCHDMAGNYREDR